MLVVGRALLSPAQAAAAGRALPRASARSDRRADLRHHPGRWSTETGLATLLVEQNAKSALSIADTGVVHQPRARWWLTDQAAARCPRTTSCVMHSWGSEVPSWGSEAPVTVLPGAC